MAVLAAMNSSYTYLLDSIKSELALTYTESGALMSFYFLGYTLGQLPWGLLADKVGSRKVMSISVLGVSASTMFFGFADSFYTAALTRFFSGLLGAGVFVPSVRLISGWYEARERGASLGILNIGGSIGLIIVTWASPTLGLLYGWRFSIIFQGLVGVVLSTLVWFTLRDRVHSVGSFQSDIINAIKQSNFWLLAFSQFIRLGGYYTFLAWLPLLIKENYGFDIVFVSTAMSFFSLAGMVSNPIGGALADRLGEKTVLSASFAMLVLNIYVLALLPSGVLLFVCTFLLGWLINFVRSPSFTIIPRLFGNINAGSLSGLHNTFASLGAFCLPIFVGIIKDTTGSYMIGWISLSVFMLIGATLIALVRVPEN